MSDQQLTRLAVVDSNRCRPKDCQQECKKRCPVVQMGRMCIEVTASSKMATIAESLCTGCNSCVKACPMKAIDIIRLPKELDKETTHRYGANGFKLHRLPTPRAGRVLGLVGSNGMGKSTALMILAGKIKANLGRFDAPPDWTEIIKFYRGSELQNYLNKVVEDQFKCVLKPQYVDSIPKTIKGTVDELLTRFDERGQRARLVELLELGALGDRQIDQLSGGELQRFAIAITTMREATVYIYDEPSSYLDIQQRLRAAQAIRELCSVGKYVIVVEHDLSLLDYLSDHVSVLYGKPGAYGVVSAAFSVREGVNNFLAGWLPTENLRFRDYALTFKVADTVDDEMALALQKDEKSRKNQLIPWPAMTKTQGDFKMRVEAGGFATSEIVILIGRNGTGKSTFIKMLAGMLSPDADANGEAVVVPSLNISYKPQMISPKFDGTVHQLLHNRIPGSYTNPMFVSDVMRPMMMEELMDRPVKELSGGELQRTAIVMALGKPADIYLIDEPSSYLDVAMRIITARVIKRFILHARKTAFIVEHDLIMATYMADRVIVYSGTPAVDCTCHSPQTVQAGMNAFLRDLNVTFRRDPVSHRPRINKLDSVKDREQKAAGTYYYIGNDE